MGENLRISSCSILGSPSSYMTLHPTPSEFPYIWRKFSVFFFYQRDVRTKLFSLLSDCSTVEGWKVWPGWQNHPLYQWDVRTTLFTLLADCSTVQEWKVWPAWQNHPHHLLASMCLAGVPHRRREGGDLATSVAICVYTVCTQYNTQIRFLILYFSKTVTITVTYLYTGQNATIIRFHPNFQIWVKWKRRKRTFTVAKNKSWYTYRYRAFMAQITMFLKRKTNA
jgi:hypothetical protein